MMLSDVYRVHSVDGWRVLLAGWHVLADWARLGRPGSRLPLHAPLQAWGVAYSGGRPPTACY